MLFHMKDQKAAVLENDLNKLQKDGPAVWASLPEDELFTPAGFSEEQAEATAYSNYSYWGSTFRAFFKNKMAVALLIALVAVVAFGLNSAAYLAEVIRSGIMAVDKGQMEAGRSLGLSYATTMRRIVMPQAFKNVLPAIGNELITLLKETSISGYIGLTDLTKGSDIIRSITYDAMMPLGLVAAIYFMLVMALSTGISRIEKRMRKNEYR